MSYEQDWNDLAALDPFWAIMSDARHKHGGWDVDAFFATGELEVAELMAQAADLGGPGNFRTALDFGCGPPLAQLDRLIDRVRAPGLDVSLEMVKLARELNSALPNCEFVHSIETDLTRFDSESFDFIYCNIVLQHLSDRQVIRRYLSEFIRVLTAGGLLVFRLPTTLPLLVRLQPRRTLYGLLRRAGMSPRFLYFRLGLHPISMTAMAEAEVRASLGAAGAETTTVQPGMDPNFDFASTTYFVTRSPRANDAARLRTDAVDG